MLLASSLRPKLSVDPCRALFSTTPGTRSLVRRSVVTSANMSPNPLVFWNATVCPYAHRTWLALEEKKLPYKTVEIDLQNKSQEFQDLYHTVHADPSARAKVPILQDGDLTLIESSLTVDYLDKKFPSAGTRLYPDDPAVRFKVQLFADTFTEQLSYMGMLRADSAEAFETAKQKFITGLTVIDEFLKRHGNEDGGSYFLGGTYSAAETLTTPFLARSLVSLPATRDVDVLAIAEEKGLDRFVRWVKASLERQSNVNTGPSKELIMKGAEKWVVKF